VRPVKRGEASPDDGLWMNRWTFERLLERVNAKRE
jgi:hypothetical protein